MTANGTLITNVASGSFQSASGTLWRISYAVTAWVMVQNPAISVWKMVTPSVQAAGGYVTFRVCAKNTSDTTSAFNVTLTDRLPDGMVYQGGYSEWATAGNAIVESWWNTATVSGTAGMPGVGQGLPLYLRWTFPTLGPLASGCAEYLARVL